LNSNTLPEGGVGSSHTVSLPSTVSAGGVPRGTPPTGVFGSPACVSCLVGEHVLTPSDIGSFYTFPQPLDYILLGRGELGSGSYEREDKYTHEKRTIEWHCGQHRATMCCNNIECSKPHYSILHCNRRTCPNCYPEWIANETKQIVNRLLSPEALSAHRGKRLVEIFLSPENQEELYTKAQLNSLIQDGYAYIEMKGAEGGVAIFHAFRATPEAKRESIKANIKTWKWIRQQKNPEQWYEYGPHLHLICFIGWLEEPRSKTINHQINEYLQSVGQLSDVERYELLDNEGTERERELELRWVYKTKTDNRGRVINLLQPSKPKNREDNLGGLVYYTLTHTVTIKDAESSFESVRWWGSCCRKKLKVVKEEEESGNGDLPEPTCAICGAPLIPIWEWVRCNYRSVRNGDTPEPKYFAEIVAALNGDPPPPDACNFLVGGGKDEPEKPKEAARKERITRGSMRGTCELCGTTANLMFVTLDSGKKVALCPECIQEVALK